ncbi:LADA_0F14444g1_1 [Lachancea dasiensis]|uniref:Large ribosomal subunit protein mL49 n=1 Tax=Lachancea dasiensis TaxID=1072105 RepID=A0A1G4JN64_9SACH|nr:LADA_0F14444g1_1 [Lachancea dasiensis]
MKFQSSVYLIRLSVIGLQALQLGMLSFKSAGLTVKRGCFCLGRNFSSTGTLRNAINVSSSEANQDQTIEGITAQEAEDLSKALDDSSYSIFPAIQDIKPSDLVGHQSFGVKSYFVERSATGNLPVYTDFKSGGKVVTEIRRISGDPVQLRNDLQEKLKHIPKSSFRVMMQAKKVVIQGDVVKQVKNVLSTSF